METSSEDFPPSLSRRARKAAESSSSTTSRIPQNSSRPEPSHGSYAWRQTLASKNRTGYSNGSDVSGTASASAVSTSSVPSSRSQDSSSGQPRTFLRRKSPAVPREVPNRPQARNMSTRTDSSSSIPQSQTSWDVNDRAYTESPASIRVAQQVEIPASTQPVTIYPELDRYRDFKPQTSASDRYFDLPYAITTNDLPPPTPLFSATSSQHSAFSGSPSTRYSESPGPGSYSRDTTPTSMSSVSPGLAAPMRLPGSMPKTRSPARPPVTQSITRRRAEVSVDEPRERSGSLASVKESPNSSSSGSTIRASGEREKLKKKGPTAPVAPPRKSSESFIRDAFRPAHSRSTSTDTAYSAKGAAAKPVGPRAAPPRRPSRDGTSDLHSQIGLPNPVVHSNLSSTSLAERRRSNQGPPVSLSRTNTPLQAEQSQHVSAPRVGREPTPASRAAAAVPEPQPVKPASRAPTRTPSPSVASAFKSRFPLFSRRSKNVPAAPSVPAEDKAPRKGPAAGTGHEGYGRLGHVRRRSSNLTGAIRAIPGTMSSQSQSKESVVSNGPSDPFLASRMSPVVIAGGEIIHNRNMSVDSIALSRPSMSASRNNSEVSLFSQDARSVLGPSALPRGETPTATAAGHRRMPSDSSDSDLLTMKHTLAYRRSIGRLNAQDQDKARVPKPITVRPGMVTPSLNSYDTTLFSDDSTMSSRPVMPSRNDSEKIASKKLKKDPKSPRKWNIFGRHAASKKKQEEPQVAAAVKVVNKPPMAFYTMIDGSEQEDNVLADVEHVLRAAQPSRPASPKAQAPASIGRRFSIRRKQSQDTERMTPAIKRPEAKQAPRTVAAAPAPRDLTTAAQPPAVSKAPMARPTRLPQVGRIPKIETRVNTRIEPPLPSPMSFSRPFNRVSLQLPSPAVSQAPNDEFVAKGPSPPESLVVEQPPKAEALGPQTIEHTQLSPTVRESREVLPDPILPTTASPQREFITFPPSLPRKVSDAPSSTDSSCSGVRSYSEATAVIPEPNAPLAEDEVWDEYNDILGEGDVPRGHPSATSSLGKPFHLEMWGRQVNAGRVGQALETPIVPGNMGAQMDTRIEVAESECETEFEAESQVEFGNEFEHDHDRQQEPTPTATNANSSDMTARINGVLEAAGAPEQLPFSVNGFVDGHGSRTNSVEVVSLSPNRRFSTASSQTARVLRDSQASSNSNGSDDTSAMAQVNLRVGSMTVSKWLTFGHVLFSPVRDELVPVVGSLKRHSILVIDGLGNDDWSFYAAETYPAATFFNLSPRAPLAADKHASGQSSSSSSFPLSPPNHHQIQYASNAAKLPFGPQSFTCVVFRFPTAAPEAHYRNIISEARRVLKPGGYIELSILDVDMNNMGNGARRAVRKLKERMHTRAPDVSLASSSDLILRLLGRKGFADIKTCRVGVPLATLAADNAAAAPDTRRRSKRETRSLAELMDVEGPGADESITKMVAKVGRWWYDRCYESLALGRTEKSMWQDQAVLAECEAWRTSLKLMVCHAHIPDKSRVASI